MCILRSSHGRSSVKKEFLKTSPNSQKITCVRLTFFERLRHRCFLVSFVKFFNNTIFTEHLRWLLLYFVDYPLINFFCALIFKMAEEICLRKSAISAMMSDNILVVNLSIAGKSRRATKFRKSTEKDNF